MNISLYLIAMSSIYFFRVFLQNCKPHSKPYKKQEECVDTNVSCMCVHMCVKLCHFTLNSCLKNIFWGKLACRRDKHKNSRCGIFYYRLIVFHDTIMQVITHWLWNNVMHLSRHFLFLDYDGNCDIYSYLAYKSTICHHSRQWEGSHPQQLDLLMRSVRHMQLILRLPFLYLNSSLGGQQ